MTTSTILRGSIYLIEDPKKHEKPKKRPVIIIQNNMGNKHSSDTIIAIIRSNPKTAELPTGVELHPGQTGLKYTSFADMGHIYTIPKELLTNRIGAVPPLIMQRINEALKASLSI